MISIVGRLGTTRSLATLPVQEYCGLSFNSPNQVLAAVGDKFLQRDQNPATSQQARKVPAVQPIIGGIWYSSLTSMVPVLALYFSQS